MQAGNQGLAPGLEQPLSPLERGLGRQLSGDVDDLAGHEAGTGFVEVRVDAMALLPGKYYLTSGIYSTNLMHCFDSWDRSHSLVVQPGSSPERHGLVDLDVSWTAAQPN